MSFERVSHGDSRIYINDVLLKGVSSCEINTTRDVENLRSITHYETPDRILKSDQKPEATISWILGEESSDPFFDFQNSGILSVESFNVKKKDIAGVQEIKSGFLTSYSVNAAVGNPISAEAKYEGLGFSFIESGKLTLGVQTEHSYKSFLPSKIELSATFQEGNIFSFPVQSFQISVPIPRQTFKRLGEQSAKYRIPTLPSEATVSFSTIKNDITGLDFSKIVLEKGDFSFDLKSCEDIGRSYFLSNCSLLAISESTNIDGNTTIDFNYVASLTNSSFDFFDSIRGLLSSEDFQILSRDGFILEPFVGVVGNEEESPLVLEDLEDHIVASIDSRLVGKTASTDKAIFSTYDNATPNYIRSISCWAYDLRSKLTAISPWNSAHTIFRAGTLISPRHILFAAHYQINNGANIRFVKSDGTVVLRTMTTKLVHPDYTPYYPDIAIGILDSDVPADIEFAKVLPDNWASYFDGSIVGKRLPVISLDQEEKALVADLYDIGSSVNLLSPTDSQRLAFHESAVSGDSGGSILMVINGEVVLLTVHTFAGAGSGTSITHHKSAINAMMTTLGGGYQLTEVDLSSFIIY